VFQSTRGNPRHRGRLQVQGEDLEKELSYSWANDEEPLKASIALKELEKLKGMLTREQLKRREKAFEKAAAWIRAACKKGGVDAPVHSQSFYNWPKPDDYPKARVDIEVRTGKAFVP